VRFKHTASKLATWILATSVCVLTLPGAALAQQVEITPETSVTPTKTVQPWIYQMAVGAVIMGLIIVIAVTVSYLRFSPKFFGRAEPPKAPPGARPPQLARQAAGVRPAPAPPAAAAPQPAAAAARTATAVAERSAPVARNASEAPAAQAGPVTAQASVETTGGPSAETAVQADAVVQAEVAAPEVTPAPAEPVPAPSPAAQPASPRGTELDQETFDRVLKEQLDKGVDRRVAEGRARAAGVVAARKRAQG
jgi:hypothetical protein